MNPNTILYKKNLHKINKIIIIIIYIKIKQFNKKKVHLNHKIILK